MSIRAGSPILFDLPEGFLALPSSWNYWVTKCLIVTVRQRQHFVRYSRERARSPIAGDLNGLAVEVEAADGTRDFEITNGKSEKVI